MGVVFFQITIIFFFFCHPQYFGCLLFKNINKSYPEDTCTSSPTHHIQFLHPNSWDCLLALNLLCSPCNRVSIFMNANMSVGVLSSLPPCLLMTAIHMLLIYSLTSCMHCFKYFVWTAQYVNRAYTHTLYIIYI